MNEALIAAFQTSCRGDTEKTIDNAAKTLLLNAGIRHAGQRIRVNRGRHAGFEGRIEVINWSEAEVRCDRNPRWFSLWHDPDYFTVLNPSTAHPPKAAQLETRPQRRATALLPGVGA